jgi:transcription-repair coupling factor (superfamily II helicase)
MSLTQLPVLLRDEPALLQVLGRSSAVLAIPEPARAISLAALAVTSTREPLIVAVPTTSDAERLQHDLAVFLGEDAVESFPAWETLPFERVSPAIETMGRRLRTLWRLRTPGRSPRVVVAPVRALVQRLSPHVDEVEPIVVGVEDQLDVDDLVRLPARVPGRAPRRVRGARLDRRRVPLHLRHAGSHRPLG